MPCGGRGVGYKRLIKRHALPNVLMNFTARGARTDRNLRCGAVTRLSATQPRSLLSAVPCATVALSAEAQVHVYSFLQEMEVVWNLKTIVDRKRWGVGNVITSSPYGPHGEHPERWRANGSFPFPTLPNSTILLQEQPAPVVGVL